MIHGTPLCVQCQSFLRYNLTQIRRIIWAATRRPFLPPTIFAPRRARVLLAALDNLTVIEISSYIEIAGRHWPSLAGNSPLLYAPLVAHFSHPQPNFYARTATQACSTFCNSVAVLRYSLTPIRA